MSQFLDGLNLDVCSNQRRYRVQHLAKSDKFEITFSIFSILLGITILVGGIPTPLKNMKVSWDYISFPIHGKS